MRIGDSIQFIEHLSLFSRHLRHETENEMALQAKLDAMRENLRTHLSRFLCRRKRNSDNMQRPDPLEPVPVLDRLRETIPRDFSIRPQHQAN